MVGFCGYREKNERESYLVIAKRKNAKLKKPEMETFRIEIGKTATRGQFN